MRSILIALLLLAIGGILPAGEGAELSALRQKAEAGDAVAMTDMGLAYYQGLLGLTKNTAQAAIWFAKGTEVRTSSDRQTADKKLPGTGQTTASGTSAAVATPPERALMEKYPLDDPSAGYWSGRAWIGRAPDDGGVLRMDIIKQPDGSYGGELVFSIGVDGEDNTGPIVNVSRVGEQMTALGTVEIAGQPYTVIVMGKAGGDLWHGELFVRDVDNRLYYAANFEVEMADMVIMDEAE